MSVSRANVLSFLSLNLARLASSATQLSPIRRQLSSACGLMQAGGQPGKLAGLQPEQPSSAPATPSHCLKRAKRAPWPPWIVNEDSSAQVRELDPAICVVTGTVRALAPSSPEIGRPVTAGPRRSSTSSAISTRPTPTPDHGRTRNQNRQPPKDFRRRPLSRMAGIRRSRRNGGHRSYRQLMGLRKQCEQRHGISPGEGRHGDRPPGRADLFRQFAQPGLVSG